MHLVAFYSSKKEFYASTQGKNCFFIILITSNLAENFGKK